MKKIWFLLGMVFVGAGFSQHGFAATQPCHKTADGNVVCNIINTGGDAEEDLCYKEKSDKSESNPNDSVWESLNGVWWVKKVGQDCTSGKTGAKVAKCIRNKIEEGETRRSCAAYECKDGYLLYTTNKRKEISVVGKNQKVGSQGLCRSKSYLKSLCDAGCGCGEKEECVLNEVTVKNHGKDVKAFIGEELCVCVAKQQESCKDLYKGNTEAIACCEAGENWIGGKCECNEENKNWKYDEKTKAGKCIDNGPVVEPTPTTCTETDCKITINQTIRCFNNGNYFNSTENYSVCKEDLDALRLDCNGLKTRVNACQNTDCIRGLLTRIVAFDELIAKVCNSSGAPTPVVAPVYVQDNSAKIAAAKQIVSSFFGSAESNKSVWKDAQGNFNTARLASDLTAGVVLGTVGGVVSGVVIKKKQVEKGFDALHCAVGGQTVADWGDTFNVGLRR